MNIQRYVIIKAVKTKTNELIPIWDERIIFEKTELYGNVIRLKDDWHNHYSLIECIYDLKTKEISIGIELDHFPSDKELDFKIGETVLFEKSHKHLSDAKISEIVYEEYDLDIKRGKNFNNWEFERFKDIQIDSKTLYAIKRWKPFYILDNGNKIEWSHKLYHKI